MRRGDVWTVAGGKDYAGKPRPAVIVQDDRFDATGSIAIWAFTTNTMEAPLLRLLIEPSARNGLRAPCRVMIDKMTTVPKTKLGLHMGRLDDEDMIRMIARSRCSWVWRRRCAIDVDSADTRL